VFENRVLKRIFEPRRKEVTGELRELHDEELHNLYSSPSIMCMLSIDGQDMQHQWGRERKVNAYRILVGNPDGQKTLGRGRRWWMTNITIYLREIG
jgi:hypothetical protein